MIVISLSVLIRCLTETNTQTLKLVAGPFDLLKTQTNVWSCKSGNDTYKDHIVLLLLGAWEYLNEKSYECSKGPNSLR